MTYGYARVSSPDQNLYLQTDALRQARCDKIVVERVSSSKSRPEIEKLLKNLQRGDSLVVWRFDRLGRSVRHLVDLMDQFNEKGINFISLQDGIDTQSSQGRFFFHIIASLAEFERELIRERTRSGLEAARVRGRRGGRPKGLNLQAQLKALQARKMRESGKYTTTQIASKLGISKPTLYRYLQVDLV